MEYRDKKPIKVVSTQPWYIVYHKRIKNLEDKMKQNYEEIYTLRKSLEDVIKEVHNKYPQVPGAASKGLMHIGSSPSTSSSASTLPATEFAASDTKESIVDNKELTSAERLKRIKFSESLLAAATEGKVKSISSLLAKGANVNFSNPKGETPLMMASWKGHKSIVVRLLEKGADVKAQCKGSLTALHYAALGGSKDCVEELVLKEAELESKTNEGWTALHYAAKYNKLDVVRTLLDAGASKSVQNNSGKTPGLYATNDEIVKLLKI